MSKEIISLLIFVCIITILILHLVYLHTYSELKIPVVLLIATLLFRSYQIYCKMKENSSRHEIYYELILITIIILILYKYAVVKKYISS